MLLNIISNSQPNMQEEFNFDVDEIDQKANIGVVPCSLPQSLAGSRVVHYHTQQIQFLSSKNIGAADYLNNSCQFNKSNQDGLQIRKLTKKEFKTKQIQADQQQKIKKQCTFKPKTNILNQTKRNFNEFLCNQQIYSKKVKQKIQRLKQNKQNTENQMFNHNIKKQKNNRGQKTNQPVYTRLHNEKKVVESNKSRKDENLTFKPIINQKSKKLIRQEQIGLILYKDAKNRRQKLHQSKPLKTQPAETEKSNKNFKNDQHLAKKFLKQYLNVLQNYEIIDFFQMSIQKHIFTEILYKLSFITTINQQYLSSNEKQLLDQAYNFIRQAYSSSFNLFTFLLSLIGVYNANVFKIMSLDKQSTIQYFSQNLLVLNQSQAISLHKKYDLFYRNRLSSQQKTIQVTDECKFSPQINPKSQFLAQKRRKTVMQQAMKYLRVEGQEKQILPKTMTHPQFLILNKRIKDIQHQIERQFQSERRLKQCTFQPNANKKQVKDKKVAQKKPMLVLDINFGDKEDKIILSEQDVKCLPQIAKTYADKYNMNKESQQQLLTLLKSQYQEFYEYI